MTAPEYDRVKQLFHEALERDESQRTAFLAAACEGDEALRAEVQSLLDHHRRETILAAPIATVVDEPRRFRRRSSVLGRPSMSGLRARLRNIAGLGLGGQLALGVLLVIALWTLLGIWMYRGIDASLRDMRAGKLEGLVDTTVVALRQWIHGGGDKVASWGRDPELVAAIRQLTAVDANSTDLREQLLASPAQAHIRKALAALAGPDAKYAVWGPSLVTLADWSPDGQGVGAGVTPTGAALLSRVFAGQMTLLLPHAPEPITQGYVPESSVSQMGLLVPVRDEQDRVMAALMVRAERIKQTFDAVLVGVWTGESGKTYAFDRRGVLISESRFTAQLQQAGLLPDDKTEDEVPLAIRDPGGDLTGRYRASTPQDTWPLTYMARMATAGHDGVDLDGYRDYRGVRVIGAWRWLEEYGFGVATETDYAEAYAPLAYLDTAAAVMFALFVVAAVMLGFSAYQFFRLRRQVDRLERLGQYQLEEKIGEGGLGIVYRGHHALLQRPTAIKMIRPEKISGAALARFEREVRLTSQLTHPNTIEIYDYGHTPQGVFYYAMEFLEGLNLAELVARDGPLPPARAIHLLRQICGSLGEAHAMGLVHRDVKPQNAMLCRRGGMGDVVKVLDFGLVKHIEAVTSEMTAPGLVAGTPGYMAPERFRDPLTTDPRSDLYAVGAVAFFLLAGRAPIGGATPLAMMEQALHGEPPDLAAAARRPLPDELVALVRSCLSPSPDDRPATARDLDKQLGTIEVDPPWTAEDSERWWQRYEEQRPTEPNSTATTETQHDVAETSG